MVMLAFYTGGGRGVWQYSNPTTQDMNVLSDMQHDFSPYKWASVPTCLERYSIVSCR